MHDVDSRSSLTVYQISAYFKDGHRELFRNVPSRREALALFNEFMDRFETDETMFITDLVVTRNDLTREH